MNPVHAAETVHYPALLVDWLTPAYDVFVRLFLRESQIKRDLVARAHLDEHVRVLDLGAGTGTLAIAMKRHQATARVVGVDSDPAALAIATDKAARSGVDITVNVGDAAALPYQSDSFDRVVSSLVFSLLTREAKQRAAREAYRVLAVGGAVNIADFGPPHTRWGRLLARRMRRFEPIASNLDGCLPAILSDAGFQGVQEISHFATLLGTIVLVSGRKTT